MLVIDSISSDRWSEARDLRLMALKTEPTAFGSSPEEEATFSEAEWRRRTANALFAISDGKLVGSITYFSGSKIKTRHIVHIHGVFVDPNYRSRGIGRKLLETALGLIQKNGDVVKIQLTVNSRRIPAVSLYRRLGFEVVGELKKELNVGGEFQDELLMEKML